MALLKLTPEYYLELSEKLNLSDGEIDEIFSDLNKISSLVIGFGTCKVEFIGHISTQRYFHFKADVLKGIVQEVFFIEIEMNDFLEKLKEGFQFIK